MPDSAIEVVIGQTLADLTAVAALPNGSIISWRTDTEDVDSEVVGIVERDSLGDYETTLAHTASCYWRIMVEDLNPVPCTVIRVGR